MIESDTSILQTEIKLNPSANRAALCFVKSFLKIYYAFLAMLILILAAIVLMTYLAYTLFYRPKQICAHYQRTLKQLGYKVLTIPFKPFSVPIFELYAHSHDKYNDPLHISKHTFKDYDVIVTNLLSYPYLIFVNLKIAKQMMTPDKIKTIQKIDFALRLMRHSAGEGLVLVEGDRWKQRRKIISKAFTFEFIKDIIPLASRICDQTFDKLEKATEGQECHGYICGELSKIGSEIFSLITIVGFIGIDAAEQKIGAQPIHECALQIVELAFRNSRDPLILLLGLWVYKSGVRAQYRRLQHLLRSFKAFAKEKVESFRREFKELSHQQQRKTANLVQLLLFHSIEEHRQLKDEQIIDEILTFVVAGTQTTLNLFTMMIVYIFQNKAVESQLRQQISENFRKEGDFNYENLKKLELLDWIQLQTIRMGGPNEALLDRIALSDVVVADIPITRGTALNYILRPTYFDETIFQDPETFNPQRWANKSQEQLDFIAMEFGAGPRSCIGKNLALLDTKIAVIKFLQRYEGLEEISDRGFMYEFSYHIQSSAVKFRKIQ